MRNGLVVLGMLFALFIGMLDQTIVSTIVPTIVKDIGGMERFSWLFSGMMIALVIATPIAGKCADLFGKKFIMQWGLILFLIGSLLCGAAQTMTQLISYRVIQGLGAGMLIPITFAVIADLYPEEKRGTINGIFGAVAGLAAVIGPMAGAFIAEHFDWRWAFFVNITVGIPAFLLIQLALRGTTSNTRVPFDFAGAALLTMSLACLMFALEFSSRDISWWTKVFLWKGFGIGLLAFILVEFRSRNPLLDLRLFRNRVFGLSQGISFFTGTIMIACTSFIPFFIQGVLGESATSAGQAVTPLMLGLVAGSVVWGLVINRIAYRWLYLPAVLFMGIPLYALSQMSLNTSKTFVIVVMVLIGIGLGGVVSVLNLSAVFRIPSELHGTSLALVSFFRNIGSAVGVAVLGYIQSTVFKERAAELGAAVDHAVQQPLIDSLTITFGYTMVAAALALALTLLLGKSRVRG